MSRISGLDRGRSIFARLVFFISRRKLGRVIRPIRVHALHPRIFSGYGRMELAQQRANKVPAHIKSLAQIRVATRVGCPF